MNEDTKIGLLQSPRRRQHKETSKVGNAGPTALKLPELLGEAYQ
jgi:hypothetical protein